MQEPVSLVDRVLIANRTTESLEALRIQARREDQDFILSDGLLFYQDKLVVPAVDNLITDLIREAHDQISSAHPGKSKTARILGQKYYWRGLTTDVARYVRNCHACRRAHVPRDRTPGLLHLLPALTRL